MTDRLPSYRCDTCGTQSLERPPHEGVPCPMIVDLMQRSNDRDDRIAEAQIALLDAQRMHHVRMGVGTEEMTSAVRKMLGMEDGE